MIQKYYCIRTKEAPWGDYGDILVTGMVFVPEDGSPVQLERSGPFIPEMYESSGTIIITGNVKEALERVFPDINFLPVNKTKIVHIEWLNWDVNSDEPLFYPESGEPEGYFLDGEHDENTAEQMGDVWAITIPVWTGEAYPPQYYLPDELAAIPFSIFRSEKTLHSIVSQKLKEWIEIHCGEWVTFIEMEFRIVENNHEVRDQMQMENISN